MVEDKDVQSIFTVKYGNGSDYKEEVSNLERFRFYGDALKRYNGLRKRFDHVSIIKQTITTEFKEVEQYNKPPDFETILKNLLDEAYKLLCDMHDSHGGWKIDRWGKDYKAWEEKYREIR